MLACADGEASYVRGAAQFVLGREDFQLFEASVNRLASSCRVLVVARVDGFTDEGDMVGDARPIGFVTIRDEIRPSAAETIGYFREQGVTLNVISGDDPRTVSSIARVVGVPGADAYVDATTLDTPSKIDAAVDRYHVFGRVTPQQKRELVQALKRREHTVAMTGDGVNDVLALKEADCSVAMAAGSDAARNVAEIVLVDNDFASMPAVVAEGRRSINNLQRSAALFLTKTLFSMGLAALCIALPPYPFEPIQMTLINFFCIGFPSFVLALEPNRARVRGELLGQRAQKGAARRRRRARHLAAVHPRGGCVRVWAGAALHHVPHHHVRRGPVPDLAHLGAVHAAAPRALYVRRRGPRRGRHRVSSVLLHRPPHHMGEPAHRGVLACGVRDLLSPGGRHGTIFRALRSSGDGLWPRRAREPPRWAALPELARRLDGELRAPSHRGRAHAHGAPRHRARAGACGGARPGGGARR